MVERMANVGPDAMLGWADVGSPIYGLKNRDCNVIAVGELDLWNGRVDERFCIRYHARAPPLYGSMFAGAGG